MKRLFIVLFPIFCLACQTRTFQKTPEITQEVKKMEKHRPQFHFTPASNWMNDPNGMVYFDGEYHLFYQHTTNASVPEFEQMHWGHAVSKDLVHWERLPPALAPDHLGAAFSGSAVMDLHNTSGLGTKEVPAMVAIYTSAGKAQQQSMAYSLDKGRSWTKYEGNPVLPNPGIPDFRDPKVIWYEEGQKWIMSLAVADHISFYSSPDLKNWKLESEFGKGIGGHEGVWECPDLFKMKVEGTDQEKWVLLVSINPGSPNGGSGTQYFVGNFDGRTFVLDEEFQTGLDDKGIWLDYGRDNYAGVIWSNVPAADGRHLFIGWMSNWSYATVVPTGTWRSAMTVPRSLKLERTERGLRLTSLPVKELEKIYARSFDIGSQLVSDSLNISAKMPFTTSTFSLNLEGEMLEETASFTIELSNSRQQKVLFGYDAEKQQYFTDRRKSGSFEFSENFPGIHYAPRIAEGNAFSIQLLVDVASLELFADGGKTTMTDNFFPDEEFTTVKLLVNNGQIKIHSGSITELKSIWESTLY